VNAALDNLAGLASPWAYVVVATLAALESSAFVGLFVPGELALLVGGYVTFQGRASLGLMMATAACGAIVGDSVGYEIGRHFGRRLRESRPGRRVGPERWSRAETYLAERGGRAVFFGRFVGILRALVPALAGASRMPYRKFLAWNALGALLWAPGFVLLGYLAGSSYRRVAHYAGQAGLILAVVAVTVAVVLWGSRWIGHHPSEVRAFAGRWLDRPLVRRLGVRYRSQIDFVVARFRPRQALGLSLTVQLALIGLFGWAFGSVLQDVVARDDLVRVDGPITTYVVGHRTGWLTTAMQAVSWLGSTTVLVPVIVVVGLWARRKGKGWKPAELLAAALAGSVVLYDLIKPLVGRPRPASGALVATASRFAFPSGHATQAAAVLGALAYLASTWGPRWQVKVVIWTAATIAVLAVGASRVYLGVHWASDVIGGWALGALWLVALVATMRALAGEGDAAGETGRAT
jgi:undecaprenyl-diphosphatase